MAAARQALIKRIYEDPRNGFGGIADTLRQARQQDPAITRGDVVQFMETVKTREDRPQRGYNSFVPTEPMHQLQVDLADMSVFSAKPASPTRAAQEESARGPSSQLRVEVQQLAQSTKVVERVESATSGTIDLSVTSVLSNCTSEARRTSTLLY